MRANNEIVLYEKRKVFKTELIDRHLTQNVEYEEGISFSGENGFWFKTLDHDMDSQDTEETALIRKVFDEYSSVEGLCILYEVRCLSKTITTENDQERKLDTEYSEIVISHTNKRMICPVFSYGRTDKRLTVEELVNRTDAFIKYVQEDKKVISLTNGTYDVLMFPEVMSVLVHEIIGHLCEADNHTDDQISKYQIGYDFGMPITVYDDPGIPNAWGSIAFDDEGNEAKKVVLVENGKINDYMTSNNSSKFTGLARNGHARCTKYNKKPIDRMTNTIMQPGSEHAEDLIHGLKDGIIARLTGGGFMYKDFYGINVIDGLYVKNGHVSTITNCVIRGRIGDIISHIAGISMETENMSGRGCVKKGQGILPVSVSAPYVLFRSLFVEQK